MTDELERKKQNKKTGALNLVRLYFRGSRVEIAEINLASLKTVSVGSIITLLCLIFITPLIFPTWSATWHYWILLPVFAVFTAVSFIYSRIEKQNYFLIQALCLLYCVTTLLGFFNIGLADVRGRYEMFIGCFYILMTVVFVLRPWMMTLIMAISGVAYALLAVRLKEANIAARDIFSIIVGAIFAHAAMLVIFKLRINDFFSREKYKRLSRTDLLTGLLNKRSYESSCQRSMRERLDEETGALFVFDVDDFKIINDTFGHVTGDNVLEMIGTILKGIFRSGDLVGRIGGDEFSAYIKVNGEPERIIAEKAEQILSQVRENTRKAFKIEVTVSIGVCATKNREIEYREMYLNADRALYAVKKSTHDGWKMYSLK